MIRQQQGRGRLGNPGLPQWGKRKRKRPEDCLSIKRGKAMWGKEGGLFGPGLESRPRVSNVLGGTKKVAAWRLKEAKGAIKYGGVDAP